MKKEIEKLIKQYEDAAESMRKGEAHPHVPGIWDGVVRDLKKAIGPTTPAEWDPEYDDNFLDSLDPLNLKVGEAPWESI